MKRRSLGAFAAVVALVLISQLLLRPMALSLTLDAPRINRAGRQRMLSQRLAKAALAADRAGPRADRDRYVAELEAILAEWSEAHQSLRQGDATGNNGESLRRSLEAIEPPFRGLRTASSQLVAAHARSAASEARAALADILAVEGEYLARMDAIVTLYERQARARADRLLRTDRAVAALILLTLAGAGLLVLLPATRLIQRQILELRRSRDELEARVRERTSALQREVEERAEAEARHRAALEILSHASRTDTLGEMAAGLAHELNQPLGAIANYAEGCLVELERDRPGIDQVRAALRKSLAATLRAGQILSRIRRFVTRRGPEREDFEPNRAVREVVELLRDEASRRGLEIREELAPGLPLLRGDPVQLQQVLVNLIRNAFDAMQDTQAESFSVVVRTRRVDRDALELAVIDHGEGIEADRLDRIFDAYYSTRAEGMGMGLAISRTIVAAHGATLRVESGLGIGTTFSFSLPIAGPGDDAETDRLSGG